MERDNQNPKKTVFVEPYCLGDTHEKCIVSICSVGKLVAAVMDYCEKKCPHFIGIKTNKDIEGDEAFIINCKLKEVIPGGINCPLRDFMQGHYIKRIEGEWAEQGRKEHDFGVFEGKNKSSKWN